MDKLIKLLVIAVATCYVSCNDITLNCVFHVSQYKETEPTYDCFINSLTFIKNDKIVAVTGTHPSEKSNADVTGFVAGGKGVEVVPSGIEEFFPNLVAITFQGSSISGISQDDLKAFPNLKTLEIFDSSIETISADNFKFNKKLEWIDLHSNKLRSIDTEAFQGLENLKSLFLDRNVCIDKFAVKNREKVLELIEDVGKKC